MMATEKRLIDANALKEKAEPEEVTGEGIVYVQDIDEAPTVDAVEVVHGRWEDCSDKDEKGMELRCLVCGGRADSFVGGTEDWYCLWMPNFCPHCGARMDGDEDDNDT